MAPRARLPSWNVLQQCYVPDAATTLYLGIPDACGVNGTPNSCYSDNGGSYTADISLAASAVATPEPSSMILLGTWLLGAIGVGVRRKRVS